LPNAFFEPSEVTNIQATKPCPEPVEEAAKELIIQTFSHAIIQATKHKVFS